MFEIVYTELDYLEYNTVNTVNDFDNALYFEEQLATVFSSNKSLKVKLALASKGLCLDFVEILNVLAREEKRKFAKIKLAFACKGLCVPFTKEKQKCNWKKIVSRVVYVTFPVTVLWGGINTTNPDFGAWLFNEGETLVSSWLPNTPTPTPTPTTTPTTPVVVVQLLPSPPLPKKCQNTATLGDYYHLQEYCIGDGLPYNGYTHKFNGENNYTVQNGKVVLVVDTAATQYPLEFSVVESKPLPKKAGEVTRYELSILVENRQLETVCSENWFVRNGRPLNEAFCLYFPEADYLTSLGERVVGRGKEVTFTKIVTEGEAIQLSAQSIWTKQYDEKLRELQSDPSLIQLEKSGNRLMHKN